VGDPDCAVATDLRSAGTPLAGVEIRTLGRTEYEPTWRAMQAFTAERGAATRDEIWLTEHSPVYTLGLAGRREHLLRDNGIPAIKVDRGGQITYHGPGQLVAYLLYDLRRTGHGIRAMVRAIEASVSLTCTINATSREQLDSLYRDLTAHPMVTMVL